MRVKHEAIALLANQVCSYEVRLAEIFTWVRFLHASLLLLGLLW